MSSRSFSVRHVRAYNCIANWWNRSCDSQLPDSFGIVVRYRSVDRLFCEYAIHRSSVRFRDHNGASGTCSTPGTFGIPVTVPPVPLVPPAVSIPSAYSRSPSSGEVSQTVYRPVRPGSNGVIAKVNEPGRAIIGVCAPNPTGQGPWVMSIGDLE